MGPDQSLFVVIARGLLDGKHLYRDLWDVKPPGIFGAYALMIQVFGSGMSSVGITDAFLSILLCYLTFCFGCRFIGKPAAALGAITTAAWHARGGHWSAMQAEPLLITLVLVAFFHVVHRGNQRRTEMIRATLAGLLFAWAFWIKYVSLAFAPLLLFLPFISTEGEGIDGCPSACVDRKNWIRQLTAFSAGFLSGVAAVIAYLQMEGSWESFVQTSRVMPRYSLEFVRQYGSHYFAWAWGQTVHGLGEGTLFAVLCAVLIAWRKRDLARLCPILMAAILAYISVAGQLRFNPYTFEACHPFFALIRGYVVVRVFEIVVTSRFFSQARGSRSSKAVPAWIFVLAAVSYAGFEARGITDRYAKLAAWFHSPVQSYKADYWSGVTWSMPDQEKAVSEILKEPGFHSLFVWGNNSLLYLQTHAIPPSRFVSNSWPLKSWAPPEWRSEIESDVLSGRPEYVVVAQGDAAAALKDFKLITSSLETSYELKSSLPNFKIYRRHIDIDSENSARGE